MGRRETLEGEQEEFLHLADLSSWCCTVLSRKILKSLLGESCPYLGDLHRTPRRQLHKAYLGIFWNGEG